MAKRSKPFLVGARAVAHAVPNTNPAAHPVLELPARAVASLPEAITLWLRVPGAPATVCVSTARAAREADADGPGDHGDHGDYGSHGHYEQDAVAVLRSEPPLPARALSDTIVFDGAELEALVLASEADRLWHPEFLGLCFEKWRSGEFRVREHDVLAGANVDSSVTWTLAQVLQRLGATLEYVAFESDVREEHVRVVHAAA